MGASGRGEMSGAVECDAECCRRGCGRCWVLPRVAGDVSADCGPPSMTLTGLNGIDKTHLEAMLGACCRKKKV